MKKLLIIALVCCAVAVQAGVIYTATSRVEMYGESVQQQEDNEAMQSILAPQEMKVFAEDKGVRVKFMTDHILYKKGDFLVSEDGETMYICDPEAKTYHRLDLTAMLGKAQGVMKAMQKMTKMTYSNVFVNVTEMGDGGEIAGYPTTKYRLLVEYDVNMKILFKKVKQHTREEYFIYATRKLPFDMLSAYSNRQVFAVGVEQVDMQVAEKVKDLGFPLKTEHLSYGQNNELTSKAVFEITGMEEKDLNPALFKLPNGYTEKEMEVETEDAEGNTQKKKFKLGDLLK